jgi:DNA-binding NtrC family response regulator
MSEPRLSHESRAIRVLLVEDDVDDAELVRVRLAAAGLRVELERVESSPTFRAALARGGVDLVLADYSLPRFDGMAALEIARELRPEVPVVLISGVIGEELAIETLKLGATDYVLKQQLDRLVPVVLRAVRESEGRRRTLLEVRAAIREVHDRALALEGGDDPAEPGRAVSAGALARLHDAIGRLDALLARALGEGPHA